MCGIAGVAWDPAQREYSRERAAAAAQALATALARRGPDSEGIAAWPTAVLAHRRLAIIDLSDAGRQPMLSEDGQVGLVFNGCIYNFRELGGELESRGHRFRSASDTEVILRGYLEWGAEVLLERMRGMFALGVWDERERKLVLARDRLGVKPVVYADHGGSIAFASTVAALRQAGFATSMDPRAVLEYLEWGYVTDDRAIFSEAKKLPAGTVLTWQQGRCELRRYWSLPEPEESSSISFEEAVEETERLLIEAVRVRLYADVPIGALLSAGIDSTLVCWAMAKLNAKVRAYTVSTEGDVYDEAPAAEETARRLGVPHEVVILEREQENLLTDLVAAYGEPFGCSSALAMLRVSRAVKPMATVLLTGDGGDDVFLGYEAHRKLWLAQQWAGRFPAIAAPLWHSLRPIVPGMGIVGRAKHFLDFSVGGLGGVTRAHNGLPFYVKNDLIGERLAGLTLPQREIPFDANSGRRVLADVLQYDQRMQFVCEFMTKVDGGAMYYAIEARSPFLDQRLWEFAARLPLGLRLRGGTLKAILREIARKHVGRETALRPKRGFTIPVEEWLAGRWRQALEELAGGTLLEKEGWIRPGKLGPAIRRSLAGGRAPQQIWYLLVLEHWLRAQTDSCAEQAGKRGRAVTAAALLKPTGAGVLLPPG